MFWLLPLITSIWPVLGTKEICRNCTCFLIFCLSWVLLWQCLLQKVSMFVWDVLNREVPELVWLCIGDLMYTKNVILEKISFSPRMISKTKGLEKSLYCPGLLSNIF